ncbi:Glutaredoxin- protein 5, mitochondrial [Desmophyllum pertusum]|uniref:Glutaredoxin- protein 5, mitochondrial n=1 Tax=Desmophyllum pertusum TaxID=174260 RepID=A0A9X0D8L7_9CNID|nr:Glutaredoxin- protein 5, mitochondrial [Desmophyllum pertusum]
MAALLVRRILNKPLSLRPSTSCIAAKLRYFSDQEVKWTTDKFDEVVNKDKVVVFMKGVPAQPMCGFSNAVVQILQMHGVEGYGSYNVLEDEELRQGVKEYSSWPTVSTSLLGRRQCHGTDSSNAWSRRISYNVLEDEELRQGVKEYSSWPTVPQVYFGGEFIGGCDIVLQLHQNGELIDALMRTK